MNTKQTNAGKGENVQRPTLNVERSTGAAVVQEVVAYNERFGKRPLGKSYIDRPPLGGCWRS